MASLFLKFKNHFFNLFLKQTVICLIILFCIGIGVALSNMSSLSKTLIESQSVQNSRLQANSIINTWKLYSRAAVIRLGKIKDVSIRHDYFLTEGSIPPPASFIIELGTQITENEKGAGIGIYSDYPYPWRKDRAKNEFAEEALKYLRDNPGNKEFYRVENNNNPPLWKYAQAIIMDTSCVACHNTDPNSPKKTWNVGDVRGVIAITQSLDEITEQTKKTLGTASIMFAGFSALGISGLALVINRLNQTTKELESRVRERTGDLTNANEDLEKRNTLIRQVFGRYLSDEIVTNLLDSPQSFHLGGERRKITILTSDLRGFTAISERLSPEEVITILNIYLESMADIITQYQGSINEFMGDGILVLFGAPTERDDDSLRAIACAIKMQLAIRTVNQKLKKLGFPQLEMGIGINTGLVVVGNIGSEKRSKYGIVGSQVNLTYRIESYTIGGQVFISESTLRESGSIVSVRGQNQVQAKGVKEPIIIYDIEGIRGSYNLFLPSEEENFVNLTEAIAIQYTILEDKHLGSNVFFGSLIELSKKGAKIQVESPTENTIPSVSTNLKINLFANHNSSKMSEDIYAKVSKNYSEGNIFYIHFTTKIPALQEKIDKLF
ncbi:MAG: adenylate/guanylate cyclase domain-containing protein [Dolichospermum sp. DET50]|nr:adenylate/guanylate cyclase domain-containing protein [Dolichospermum sp. DET66]MBS3034300.1 adenylate/guanylate cyclase domain-containing protein [Dolichospermum sp. DET67]MBS3039503.1 adenylate/guanylate cyclase domain-containing protein [Dolichospermum sp. DET50]QSX66720.1 MAG: adenylate/guanylate cyclase domain-containing protein [Dolichospermum sp. DET69]